MMTHPQNYGTMQKDDLEAALVQRSAPPDENSEQQGIAHYEAFMQSFYDHAKQAATHPTIKWSHAIFVFLGIVWTGYIIFKDVNKMCMDWKEAIDVFLLFEIGVVTTGLWSAGKKIYDVYNAKEEMLPTEIPSIGNIMRDSDDIITIRSATHDLTIRDRIAKVFKPDIVTLNYLTIVFNRNMDRVATSINQLCSAIHGSSAANTTEHIQLKKNMSNLEAGIGELRTDFETGIGELRTDFETGIGELRTDMTAMRADMTAMRADMTAMRMMIANQPN
jgi:hypothetical protein